MQKELANERKVPSVVIQFERPMLRRLLREVYRLDWRREWSTPRQSNLTQRLGWLWRPHWKRGSRERIKFRPISPITPEQISSPSVPNANVLICTLAPAQIVAESYINVCVLFPSPCSTRSTPRTSTPKESSQFASLQSCWFQWIMGQFFFLTSQLIKVSSSSPSK